MRRTILTISVFAVLIALFAFAANDWKLPGKKVEHGQDWCPAHEVELSKCEKCNPSLARGGTRTIQERKPNEGECPNTVVRIELAPEAARQVDIRYHTVQMQSISETVRGNSETMYPPSRHARVAPRIGGVIRDVNVVLGQDVEAGALLAALESTDFGEAKSAYLQSLAILGLRKQTYEQEVILAEKKVSTGRELLQAKTELEEARLESERAAQKLAILGLSEDQIRSLAEKKDTTARFEVTSPLSGRIVEASAVAGETASPEHPIFAVANLDRLWVSVDIQEADLAKVEKDQRAVFMLDSLPGQRFTGKVVAIGSDVDDRTRTVRVFAEVKNVQGLLKARMFGRAEISVKPPEEKLLVPKEAVQSDGDCTLVFLTPSKDKFQARKIEIGTAYQNGYEVLGGLAAGDTVVTTGSFLLKTEVLRGQMGAG